MPDGDLAYLYRPVVEAAAATNTAVEISSQGLLRTINEIYPAPGFLRLFREAGVPITLGSDAHSPDEAGFGYGDVIAAARAVGYGEYLRFEARRRIPTPLPDLGSG